MGVAKTAQFRCAREDAAGGPGDRVRWSGFGRTEQQLSRLCRLPAATAALSLQSGAKANDALSRVCRVLRPSQGRLSGFTTEKF